MGDVDGNSLIDVVVSISTNSPAFVAVIAQMAPGRFSPEKYLSSYEIPGPLLVGDIDGDRRADVIVLHPGWGHAGVYLQQNGGLGAERLFATSRIDTVGLRESLAMGDLDSDGCRDLAIATYNGLDVLYGLDCTKAK